MGKMTVCIAALAQESKAIVCVADTAISYGDSIQWDSDSSKIFELNPSGTLVLFAGGEEATSRVLGKVISRADEIGKDIAETKKILEDEYKEAVEELVAAKFITPRLMTKADYIKATSLPEINSYIRGIASEVQNYVADCALIVCGFDDKNRPFILTVDAPGVVSDMTTTGFHSIGSGWEKSISKMLFSEHKKAHLLGRAMYDIFDAKAFAEMAVGVGFNWDTWVITSDRKSHKVPDKIDLLVEHLYGEHERSPFDKPEKDDEPLPKNWRSQLDKYCKSIMPSTPEKSGDQHE
jgi:20S proteasome alpha/beta subunit